MLCSAALMTWSPLAWIRRQAEGIASDRVLRFYGVALAAAHAITWLDWTSRDPIARYIARGMDPICWPFWESCGDFRFLTVGQADGLLWAYLALALASGVAFFRARTARTGYAGLVLLEALHLAVLVQDFRLRMNQHYMLAWIVLAFLFGPARRALLPALLASFYFWAGVLKLDYEWLSGSALYHTDRFWIPAPLVPASCAYVVVMETVLVFGIFSRRAWLFWVTIAQLAVFHVFSWAIVGFYYPLLMFALLSVLVLARTLDGPEGWPSFDLIRRDIRLVAPLLAVFAALQLVPYAFPGDTALTGEGRLFALNMFDARVVCEAGLVVHRDGGKDQALPMHPKALAQRIACDPISYFNMARAQCVRLAGTAGFRDFDLHLRSRRTSDPELRDVVDVKDFCSAGLTYDLWRPNDWILK
jgi:hypothetical protein